MKITLTGIQRFRVMDMVLAWKPGHRVGMKVAKGLIEKVFPSDMKASCQLPNNPAGFDVGKLAALPTGEVDLSEPEAEALKSALEAALPTISVIEFDWYDALLESVTEKESV